MGKAAVIIKATRAVEISFMVFPMVQTDQSRTPVLRNTCGSGAECLSEPVRQRVRRQHLVRAQRSIIHATLAKLAGMARTRLRCGQIEVVPKREDTATLGKKVEHASGADLTDLRSRTIAGLRKQSEAPGKVPGQAAREW